jgi:hypothetical protein
MQDLKFRLSKKISHRQTLLPLILSHLSLRHRLSLIFKVSRQSRTYVCKDFALLDRSENQLLLDRITQMMKNGGQGWSLEIFSIGSRY